MTPTDENPKKKFHLKMNASEYEFALNTIGNTFVLLEYYNCPSDRKVNGLADGWRDPTAKLFGIHLFVIIEHNAHERSCNTLCLFHVF